MDKTNIICLVILLALIIAYFVVKIMRFQMLVEVEAYKHTAVGIIKKYESGLSDKDYFPEQYKKPNTVFQIWMAVFKFLIILDIIALIFLNVN